MKEREYTKREREIMNMWLNTYQHDWKRETEELKRDCKYRINRCNAYYSTESACLVWIKSYDKIVACYDKVTGTLYSFGRFSATTYQHIRKFKNDYTQDGYYTKELNFELENWFK